MAELTRRLTYEPPFDWPALLRFFAARAIPGVDEVEDLTYHRTFAIGRTRGRLAVTPADGALLAEVTTTASAAEDLIKEKLRRLFDLDASGKKVATHLRRSERLAPLLKKRPGLRVPGVWDAFELGVRAILGQQVSVAAASTLAGRIAQKFGAEFGKTSSGGGSSLTRLFPKPEQLAEVNLNGLGLTTRRAATVTTFAREVARDPTLLSADQPLDAFVERVADLPGFGPWTAHYMAMRMGHADAFPASDLGVRKALGTTSDKEVLRRAEAWRPYRAYATMHLWASLSD
ncbi:MAG: DNA-3-methyladenine glycosylase 2 family protein [Alphaproteobacteria bacterium]|nr:DNA-3-methyladenine glycosylase 2 family protein [Alphaproteobacteria bacterium]